MKLTKKITYIVLAMIMVLTLLGPWGFDMRSRANQTGTITGDYLRLREAPDGAEMKDASGNTIYLRLGTKVTILDTSNSTWYKIEVTYNGQNYTGYSASQYISIGQTSGSSTPSDDADFETKLANEGFPESYKVMLRDLHAKYPSWEFKAVHTGLDWSQVVAGEVNSSSSAKNLVQGTASLPRYSWRSTTVGYNYKKDTWTPFDGSTWYAASDQLVTYYLDPRTYMYENYIFVFESLSYVDGMQTEAGVEAILSGTFMSNTVPTGESLTYAQLIVEAGKNSGVSPYHIASRIKQEMGSSGNVCAFGNSTSYPGIYNFYNIGAYDGNDAATKGLAWAATEGSYGRPWNTPYKSILGGAQFLGTSYINVGQDTLYTQKFNVTNTSCLFSHQYMTNVQAPASEALTVYNAYSNNNLLNSTLVFEIPVYGNMPETATSKPADAGNPNNWLESLTVDGYALTPTFDVNMTTEYTLTVSENISSINISASPVNKSASVSGTGTISLTEGSNLVSIVVTAQNGNTRTYNITVNRGTPTSGGTTATGTTMADLNGDNVINYKDIVKIQRIIMGLESSSNEVMSVGDINKDGVINYKDIVKVQRHIMGLELIQ